MKIDFYTDGGCRGNPGPGGCAFVRLNPNKKGGIQQGFSLHHPHTTNNQMELLAIILVMDYCLANRQEFQLELADHQNGPGKEVVTAKAQPAASQYTVVDIHIYTDSKYALTGIEKHPQWLAKNWILSNGQEAKNKALWIEFIRLFQLANSHRSNSEEKNPVSLSFKFIKIKGHAGHLGNELADEWAVNASHNQVKSLGLLTNTDKSWQPTININQVIDKCQSQKVAADGQNSVKNKNSKNKINKGIEANEQTKSNLLFEEQYPLYLAWLPRDQKLMSFSIWADCQKYTSGQSGAKFKKVKNDAERSQWLRKNNL